MENELIKFEGGNNISITEYLHILQLEAIQYDWCSKNFDTMYKEKYDKFVDDRFEIIEDIALKIPDANIFNSETIYNYYVKLIFDGIGVPNFYYRTEKAKTETHHHNLRTYFTTNDFIYRTDNMEDFDVVILSIIAETEHCLVEFGGEKAVVPMSKLLVNGSINL